MLVVIYTSLISADNTSPYQFLRFNSGARASALAGATVSMPEDASMMFFNPASISTVENKFLNVYISKTCT